MQKVRVWQRILQVAICLVKRIVKRVRHISKCIMIWLSRVFTLHTFSSRIMHIVAYPVSIYCYRLKVEHSGLPP